MRKSKQNDNAKRNSYSLPREFFYEREKKKKKQNARLIFK